MNIISGIYKILNIITYDFYTGSAVNFGNRWRQHRWELRRNIHGNEHLQNAWNKYGEDAFEFSILLYCDIENLLYYEQVVYDGLKPTYNISPTAGSSLGVKHTAEARAKTSAALMRHVVSPETRAKMSAARMGNQNALGYKHSPEARAKNSAANRGRKKSPEHRAKMSAAHMGRKKSPETRAKMSAAGSKPVLQYTKSGEFIAEYVSVKAAQAATGISRGHISLCCNGKQKSSGGFVWKFKTAPVM